MPNQTGPKTPEGKQASSQNRRRHGLSTPNIIVHPADQPAFDEIEATVHVRFGQAKLGVDRDRAGGGRVVELDRDCRPRRSRKRVPAALVVDDVEPPDPDQILEQTS